jgi:hypothetical protein
MARSGATAPADANEPGGCAPGSKAVVLPSRLIAGRR